MNALIEKLRAGTDLNPGDIGYAVSLLVSDKTDAGMKASFLTALAAKGETTEEIAGFAEQLIDRAVDPMINPAELSGPLIDVCGTGGSGLNLFNVSTTIMFILAAGGAAVVKHGNRRVTSSCGSADVLEALGIKLDWPPEELRECLDRIGLAFVYAREYHPAFRALAQMRAQLASENRRTIFNLLGPLLNPARPARQLVGVYTPRLTSVFADVLRRLGRKRAWVVCGATEDGRGMDDVSTCGATTLGELDGDKISSAVIDCRWLGIPEATVADLECNTGADSAQILEGILRGEVQGAKRDLSVVNAAAGFVVAGLAPDLNHGIALAREQIDSGAAAKKLRALRELSAA